MSYHAQKRIGRAVFETLEDRRLLSAVTFADGVLTITGDLEAPNTLSVNVTHNGTRVWGIANNLGRSVSIHDVTMIQVIGGEADDIITVDPQVAGLVWVQSKGGNDEIRSSRGGADSPQEPPAQPQEPPVSPPPSNPTGPDPTTPPPQPPEPPPQDHLAPQPVIRFIDGTRMVGNAVHVHGLDTLLQSGSVLTARFDWDFGDPHGRYNNLTGFNAAHVYDHPGTYTITLRVTDEAGRESIVSSEVTVLADTRTPIYVSNSGSAGNSGLSPTQAVPLTRAVQLLGDNTKLLLRRGERFDLPGSIQVPYSNVLIGAYGQGTAPVLYSTTNATGTVPMINLHDRSRDVTISDITFDSKFLPINGRADKVPPSGIAARGKGITVREVQFLNVSDGINANGRPTGLLVMDSRAPLETGIRSYFTWMEGTDHVYLGNSAANSTREHILRAGVTGVERLLIAHNDFANISRTAVDNDIAKTTLGLQVVKHVYVTGNTLTGGPVGIGPLRHEATQWNARSEWIVLENNTFRSGLEISPGSHHIMARNNMMVRNGGSDIFIRASDPNRPDLTISDIYLLDNISTNESETGTFLRLVGSAPNAITMTGNQYNAPNLVPGSQSGTGHVTIADNDLSTFNAIRNNTWAIVQPIPWTNGGVFYVGSEPGLQASYRTQDWWISQDKVDGDRFIYTILELAAI